jgi:hypothetical protein
MRKLSGLLFAAALAPCLAGGASAELLRWKGTLTTQLVPIATVVATGEGFATVNGPGGGLGHLATLSISGGISSTGWVANITDPAAAPLVSMRGSVALGAGVLRPISGGAASAGPLTQGVLPLTGIFKLCLLFTCPSFLPVPLTVSGTRGMGIGGTVTVNGYGLGIQISVSGAPWTVKTAVVTGIPTDNGGFESASVFGFAHGPASETSSTAKVGGVVQLVTPGKVVTNLGTGTVSALFGILTTHFVPEPQTFLLFAAGLASLGIARRRRAKK